MRKKMKGSEASAFEHTKVWKKLLSSVVVFSVVLILACVVGPTKQVNAGDYSNGGCVRWVKDRARAVYGVDLGTIGNGNEVFANLKAKGYQTGWEPRPNAIACWQYNTSTNASWRKLGHVAWVENVQGSTVYVSEGGYVWEKKDQWGNVISVDYGWHLGNKGVIYRAKSNLSGSGFLGYVYLKSAPVVKPSAPSNVTLTKTDIGLGECLTATWNAVSGASVYDVKLECITNSNYNQSGTVTATSGSFAIKNPGSYRVSVTAKNSAGSSTSSVSSNRCVAHENVQVLYEDYDGTLLGPVQVFRWGGSATPVTTPNREGYDFTGWDHDGKNVKQNLTIKAQYKKKSFSVSFVDYKGDVIGNIQKVEYKDSATPPSEVPVKDGYIFSEWDTKDFQSVTRNMTVKAVYVWENTNLPIVTKIVSAKRNAEATGYDVEVKLSNFPNDFTSGKLVAALKTKKGKMVASEIRAVSMPTDGETTVKFTILYSGLAPQLEVSMIGVADDDTTGTPKSKLVASAVDIGNEWSDWGTEVPDGNGIVKESRTEYRYKTKKEIKSATTPVTPTGYTLESTQKLNEYTAWSGWSNYAHSAVSSNATTNVQTTTGYRYYAFVCPNCGARDPYSGSCSNCGASGLYWVEDWGTCLGQNYGPGWQSVNNSKGKIYWKNAWWYFEKPGANNGQGGTGQPTAVLYSYQTRQQLNLYTYWSSDYSEWSGDKVTADSSTRVETRTAYRFKTNATEVPCYNYKRYKYTNVNNGKVVYTYTSAYADSKDYPGEWEYKTSFTELNKVAGSGDDEQEYGTAEDCWYKADVNKEGNVTEYKTVSSLEDQSGTVRTLDGKLEGSAGKVATLMIYKGKNTDPIASQIEYIGQTKIGEDGSYHFEYVTKEEPTEKTGDFMITLGVEGATNYIDIGKIDAPKKVYTVDFLDESGNLIGDHKSVAEGGTVEAPEAPEKEGYEFIGWDTALRNIQENTVVTAIYHKQKYTVVFVDWDESCIDVKEYDYGDELKLPEKVLEKTGEKFSEWVDADGKSVEKVTKNMVVTAKYKESTYTVTFTDYDGNVISEQEVKYGSEAKLPDNPAPQNAKQIFAGWSSDGDEKYIIKDLVIKPLAMWKDDSEKPAFTIKSGTYEEAQKIVIYSESTNTDIYYAISENGLENSEDDFSDVQYQKYEKPFTVNKDCVITAYAISDSTNQSDLATLELKFKNSTATDPDPKPDPTPDPDPKPEQAVLESISASKEKTVYSTGDTLKVDDLTVTAKYSDGTSKKITDYTTNASDLDMYDAGVKDLKISYTENGKTVSTVVKITVKKRTDNPITLKKENAALCTLKKAQTYQIVASAKYLGLEYTSLDDRVKVDGKGKVTIPANYKGKAEILVSTKEDDRYWSDIRTVTITVSAHTFAIKTTLPTVFKKGVATRTCKRCGYKETVYTAKVPAVIKLSSTKKTIKNKKNFTLKITKLGRGDSIKSYKSSKSIVTIKKTKTNQYKITGKKKGTTKITFVTKAGKKATCTVTVK